MANAFDEKYEIALAVVLVLLVLVYIYYKMDPEGAPQPAPRGGAAPPLSASAPPCISCGDTPGVVQHTMPPSAPAAVAPMASFGPGGHTCGQIQPWTNIGLPPHCDKAPRDQWLSWL